MSNIAWYDAQCVYLVGPLHAGFQNTNSVVAQSCNSRTLQPEQASGLGSIFGSTGGGITTIYTGAGCAIFGVFFSSRKYIFGYHFW